MAVLRPPVTVDAHPDLDAQLPEQFEEAGIEPDAVGLDGESRHGRRPEGAGGTDGLPDPLNAVPQPLAPREQRLSPVQNDVNARQRVLGRMLGDPLSQPVNRLRGHHMWQCAPLPVVDGKHVAVVARQVAPSMDLDDELAKWLDIPVHMIPPAGEHTFQTITLLLARPSRLTVIMSDILGISYERATVDPWCPRESHTDMRTAMDFINISQLTSAAVQTLPESALTAALLRAAHEPADPSAGYAQHQDAPPFEDPATERPGPTTGTSSQTRQRPARQRRRSHDP